MSGFDLSPVFYSDICVTYFRAHGLCGNVPAFSIPVFRSKPGGHRWNRFIYPEKGKMQIDTGEEIIKASEGEIVFIPNDSLFSLKWLESENNELANAYVVEFNIADFSGKQISLSDRIAVAYNDESGYYLNVFKEICSFYVETTPFCKMKTQSLFFDMLSHMIKDTSHNFLVSCGNGIFESVEFINANYSSDIDVSALIKSSHLSPSTFRRHFLAYTGMSPVSYINYLRIKRAYELLSDGNMTVSEVAAAINLPDPSYFSKVFKKIYGCAPRAVKK